MVKRSVINLLLVCALAPSVASAQDVVSQRVAAAFAVSSIPPVTAIPGERPTNQAANGRCAPADKASITDLVRKIANDESFDPDLAEAVAWAESDLGRNQGPSKAGALGILQLMPGTASDLGVKDRCDASENVRAGIRYLKALYNEFQDPLLMLAAYNAGSGNVYRSNGIPVNDETTKYVIKILNRWKLSNAVNKQPAAVSNVASIPTKPEKSEVSADPWQDGHVIDFTN